MGSTLRVRAWSFFLIPAALCFVGAVHAADEAKPYDLNDPSEPWQTSKSGITTSIMPPYTPLVRKDSQVQCWGRSYDLDSLFPTSAISQGQKILARPIALKLKMGGKWTTAKAKGTTFSRVRADRIDFESSAGAGPIEISTKSWIEYDGLVRTDLTLAGGGSAKIEGLRLAFAFTPEASIFHHAELRWGPEIFKRSPTKPGVEVSYPWLPLVWVGNHDVGLTIVTETWDGWTSPRNAIRLKRNSKDVSLTFEIVTAPMALQGERTYSFGLLATPAKPMPEERWSLIIGKLPGQNVTTIDGTGGRFHQPLFSFPQPGDFTKMAEMLAKFHQRGIRYCYYITTSATSAKSAVGKRHYDEWLMSKEILKGGEWKGGTGLIGVEACCPASGFADFMAWAVEQAIKHMDIDGIYIDNPGPYWCGNARHGCGRGGKKTYPFFALRDLHKRLYTVVKSNKPNALIWEHTSRTFNPLQLAWIDIYSDGEPYRIPKHYPKAIMPKVLSRTYFEISGTGHQVGAIPCFLHSMGVRTDGDWSHWLLSRTLPWGQMIWGDHAVYMDGTPASAATQARVDFGLGKEPATFYRPHELPKWFKVSSKPSGVKEDLIVCLWQRKRDQAVLAVLANWTDQPVLARINQKSVAGRLGPCICKDAMTGVETLGPFAISIPANSFRMVTIERKQTR